VEIKLKQASDNPTSSYKKAFHLQGHGTRTFLDQLGFFKL
jgi:hypothetical protein